MAPRHISYRVLRQRMRRSLYYGQRRMEQLSMPLSDAALAYFHATSPYDYLDEKFAATLAREACISPCSLIVALIYLERARENNVQEFVATDPSELYLSAQICANKYLYDDSEPDYVYNDEWAASSSMNVKCVNRLEIDMLKRLNWRLHVDAETFTNMLQRVERYVNYNQWQRRTNDATYSELTTLSDNDQVNIWTELLRPMIAITATATITYTACLLGIFGIGLAMRSSPIMCTHMDSFSLANSFALDKTLTTTSGVNFPAMFDESAFCLQVPRLGVNIDNELHFHDDINEEQLQSELDINQIDVPINDDCILANSTNPVEHFVRMLFVGA